MTEADIPLMGFAGISVARWRQFEAVELDMHPNLTILTGANASGKSTLLGILGRHFNWTRVYSSSPFRVQDEEGLWYTIEPKIDNLARSQGQSTALVGSVRYGTGGSTEIRVPTTPTSGQTQYDLTLPQIQIFPGVYLPSHRAVSGNYAPVHTIPTSFGGSDQLFEQFTNEIRTRWAGSWTGKTPQLALKEALIAAAVFGGSGNDAVEPNPDATVIWSGFENVLGQVLPASLGFKRMRVRVPDIVVETRTGDFILDEASGGMSAIIEMSWQIFLRSRNQPRFTVILDEPENHLHPSLQKQVMPSLLRAFPAVQFIVATHSPFVVTSTPDSAVYVLDYNEAHRVVSRKLDYTNKAANADETLRRVLGLESTYPTWAEGRFEQIVNAHLAGDFTMEN